MSNRPLLVTLCAAAMIACACAPPPPVEQPPPPPPPPVAVVPTATAAPAPVKRHRRQAPEVVGNRVRLPGQIEFKSGNDELDRVSDDALESVVDYLLEKPEVTLLRVEGHTDNVGSKEANQSLSEKRAMSVVRWLIGKGIDCHRLIPVGYGETRPEVPNESDANRHTNRRVDFVNAELQGSLVDGKPRDGGGGRIAGNPCAP